MKRQTSAIELAKLRRRATVTFLAKTAQSGLSSHVIYGGIDSPEHLPMRLVSAIKAFEKSERRLRALVNQFEAQYEGLLLQIDTRERADIDAQIEELFQSQSEGEK